MRRLAYILACVFMIFTWKVNGQVLRSEKSFIKAKSQSTVSSGNAAPPEIRILSPDLEFGTTFITTEPVLNLIGKVTDEKAVNTLIIDSQVIEISENGVFSMELQLSSGITEVSVVTMDKNDNVREYKLLVELVPEALSLADKVKNESKYYALLIGINNYFDPPIRDLDHAIQDAEELYAILVGKYNFEEDYVELLKDARRNEISYALEKLSRTVTPNDNLLIFYAGHGTYNEKANIGYWLPSDARKVTKIDWLSNSMLVDYLKQIDSRHTLLITDACFAGSIFNSRAAFYDAPNSIEKLYELPSRKAMTSGMLTEVPDQSAFINYLIDRLKDNQEKYLSAYQLFSIIREPVINNSDAVPQYGEIRNVGDEGGDFIFIKQ